MGIEIVKHNSKVKEITTGIMVYYGKKLFQHGTKSSIKNIDKMVQKGMLKTEQYTKAQILIFAMGEVIKQIAYEEKRDVDTSNIDIQIQKLIKDIDL